MDHDLEKICSFYQLKELEIYGEVEALLKDEHDFEEEQQEQNGDHDGQDPRGALSKARKASIFKSFSVGRRRRASTLSGAQEGDSDDERTGLTKSNSRDGNPYDMSTSSNLDSSSRRRPSSSHDLDDQALDVLYNEGVTLKKRAVSLYVTLCELRSFIQLNKTGFSKVLKKYDKTLDRKLKNSYLKANVDTAYPFQQETTDRLNANIEKIESAYADIVTKGDVDLARRELRLHLREHVVWERNTVWREMIGIERKAQAANLGLGQTMLGGIDDRGKARLQGDEEQGATKEVVTPIGKYRCPRFLLSATFYTLVVVVAIFFVLLFAPIMESPVEQNCLALVVLVSLLWATEAIPLFVTSLLVPFLVVVLRVVRSDAEPHRRLESKAAASYVFSAMWSPVIMLLLGGFTIAAALSKYNIAKMMATFVLSKAGTKPRNVLITSMFVAMFASMWISNVAAPVLCFSIIQVCMKFCDVKRIVAKPFLAHPPKLARRLGHVKSTAPRYRSIFKYGRCSLANCFTAELDRSAKHDSSTRLGSMVLHCIARLYHLHLHDLGLASSHLPSWPQHDYRAYPSHEGQVYWYSVVHQYCHTLYDCTLVCQPPAGAHLWRHGRRRHHSYCSLLRYRYPDQGGLQQLPLDHYHLGRRWFGTRQSC